MQVKDIATGPLLIFVGLKQRELGGRWVCTWDFEGTMYADLPDRLFRAKMKNLIKHGLIDGCACGCRGDYQITERGWQYAEQYLLSRN